MLAVGVVIAIKPSINSDHHQKYQSIFTKLEIHYLRMYESVAKNTHGKIENYESLKINVTKLKQLANELKNIPAFITDKEELENLNSKVAQINYDVNLLDKLSKKFMSVNSKLNDWFKNRRWFIQNFYIMGGRTQWTFLKILSFHLQYFLME